ncbi:LysR family transcriptional regulator [Rouxiella sp. T17]|uniref:LysR family transcriptional regulator n=1 Tax=Rouxiella sp. T17 TaxID=3085684 RepID=UPI002FC922D8
MDRFTELNVFVAAVEEGSIAAAARRLGISAVMAGRYLSSLEQHVSARLIERTTQRLNLTDAGLRYFERSKRLLEEFAEANKEAADIHDAPRGTLRIAAPITFGTLFLGPLIAKFMADYPAVDISLQLQDRFVDLVEEGIDVAIRVGNLKDSDFVARKIGSTSLLACASSGYLAGNPPPVSPADLQSHTLIGYSAPLTTTPWTFIDEWGETTIVKSDCRFMANNTAILLEVALADAGIAYGPDFVFSNELKKGNLIQLLTDYACPALPIHAITPNAKYVNTKTRLFIQRLIEAFR